MGADGPNITKRRPGKTDQARTLRQTSTEAEQRLWYELRSRRLNGHKFIRQVPLGPYIADFVCREKMLIVEVDGSQHADSIHDRKRTEWLNSQGYSVLRFWNHEILDERRQTLDTILAALNGKTITSDHPDRFSASVHAEETHP